MPAKPTSQQPYNLDPNFERAVVTLCCVRPRFYSRGPHKMDSELLGNDTHKLMLNTVRALVAETGRAPSSSILVIQRLRRQMSEGTVSYEQVQAVAETIDDAIDAGLPDEEATLGELVPILKRRLQHQAMLAGHAEWSNKGDFATVRELIEVADSLGEADAEAPSTLVDGDAFEAISELRNLEHLSTGIAELDTVTQGGLHRGGLGVAIGGPGAGKSMFLSHVACQAWLLGLHVVYATLELPRALVIARAVANVTGIPIDDITAGRDVRARKRLQKLLRKGLGTLQVREFTPHATTLEDLAKWESECEEKAGRAIDLQVVDYADKLIAKPSGRDKGNHASDYTAMRVVYEGLRVRAVDLKRWSWTASQPRRGKDAQGKQRTGKLDLDDVADSMHKVRVPDLVVTLNPNDEERSMEYFVAKNRVGEGRQVAGPVPTDWPLGRMCPP